MGRVAAHRGGALDGAGRRGDPQDAVARPVADEQVRAVRACREAEGLAGDGQAAGRLAGRDDGHGAPVRVGQVEAAGPVGRRRDRRRPERDPPGHGPGLDPRQLGPLLADDPDGVAGRGRAAGPGGGRERRDQPEVAHAGPQWVVRPSTAAFRPLSPSAK